MELRGMPDGRETLRFRGKRFRMADNGVLGAEEMRVGAGRSKFAPGVDGTRPVCSLPNMRRW